MEEDPSEVVVREDGVPPPPLEDPSSLTPVVVTGRLRPCGVQTPGLRLLEDDRSLLLEDLGRTFRFDRLLGPESTQEELYELGGPRDFLPLALDGYDLNFIAYGQGKSGKTHSLFGGILPAFVKELFARLGGRPFSLKVSFIDILDEHTLDLLSWEPQGPSWMPAHSPGQVFHALSTGMSILRKRPRELFESSSSHSIFSLKCVTQTGLYRKTSLIKFVDLAGTDDLSKKRVCNGSHVDVGLLSLVNVVSALGDPRRNVSVIPYADSALTRVIGEAFGGNAVTLLLATLDGSQAEGSLNTCMFAELASQVKNHPLPNIEESRRDSEASLRFHTPDSLSPPPPLFNERPPEGLTHAPIPLRPSPSLLHSPINVQLYYDPPPQNGFLNPATAALLLAQNNSNNNANLLLNNNNNLYHPPPSYTTPQQMIYPNANINALYAQSDFNAQLSALKGQFQRLSTDETQSPIDIIHSPPPVQRQEPPPQLTTQQQQDPKLERIEEESLLLDNDEEEASEEEEDFDSEAEEDIEPLLEDIQADFRSNTMTTFAGEGFYENIPSTDIIKELSELNAAHIESQKAILRSDEDLCALQGQLRELKGSIQVKETLVRDLEQAQEESKAVNKRFRHKLRLLEERSHSLRKDLRGAQRLLRGIKGDPELQARVRKYNEEIQELEAKMGDTEAVLRFREASTDQSEALQRMRSDHAALQGRFNAELARKNSLAAAVARDQDRIRELEGRLKEQQVQLDVSLALSHDLEKQRDQLQFQARELLSQIHPPQEQEDHSEASLRQEIGSLRGLKEDLLEERGQLEATYQAEKRSGGKSLFSKRDEFRIVELDVILEAMDAAIEMKNGSLCGLEVSVLPSSQREELLLSKLASLSMSETKSLLRKFVYRTVDLRSEGNRVQAELELSEDERGRLYRKLQELNYHYASREVAYERKLDIQKTEHLKQLSALRKQINDPDAYEFKLKQLKDELLSLKQDSQRYKRFYKAYHKHFEGSSGSSKKPSQFRSFPESSQSAEHMPPPQKVTRERKKLIVQSKVPSSATAKPKRK